jgi:hypothetical protein
VTARLMLKTRTHADEGRPGVLRDLEASVRTRRSRPVGLTLPSGEARGHVEGLVVAGIEQQPESGRVDEDRRRSLVNGAAALCEEARNGGYRGVVRRVAGRSRLGEDALELVALAAQRVLGPCPDPCRGACGASTGGDHGFPD